MTNDQIKRFLEERGRKVNARMKVYHDTSDFMDIEAGDVMVLQDTPYLISRNEKEVGFGMDDEPKYRVKRTINL